MVTFGKTGAILTIDLDAIKQNYKILSDKLSFAELAAVVKANAYGIGIKEVATALSGLGCTQYFVATVDEGIELRHILPKAKIYILHGALPRTEEDLVSYSLIPVLNSVEQIESWLPYATQSACIHIDTGMSRLGLTPEQCSNVKNLRSCNISMVMSHLACAEIHNHTKNTEQLILFKKLQKFLPAKFFSLAASAGIFLGTDYHFDLCRTGVSLYGVNPTPSAQNPLKQVIRLQARIIQLRSVDSLQTVGYGATHQFKKSAKVATLGIGYADGYMRGLGNSGIAFIGIMKRQLLGGFLWT